MTFQALLIHTDANSERQPFFTILEIVVGYNQYKIHMRFLCFLWKLFSNLKLLL